MSDRQSVHPTYDSRLTGPAYHVTYRVNGKTIAFREPITDPFISGKVTLGWRDLLCGLLRGQVSVEVIVGGDKDRVDDVLELDANTLVTKSSRRLAFDSQIQRTLKQV